MARRHRRWRSGDSLTPPLGRRKIRRPAARRSSGPKTRQRWAVHRADDPVEIPRRLVELGASRCLLEAAGWSSSRFCRFSRFRPSSARRGAGAGPLRVSSRLRRKGRAGRGRTPGRLAVADVRRPGGATDAGPPARPPLDPHAGIRPWRGIARRRPDHVPAGRLPRVPAGRPPGMSVFNVFFDSPARRPFQSYRSHLDRKEIRVTSRGRRATIAIGDLTIGPFAGRIEFTIYEGSPLVHVESVIQTREERRAILYDAGLSFAGMHPDRFTWTDTEGQLVEERARPETADRAIMVRNRLLVASTGEMSLACFPPPHQFFFAARPTDNLQHRLVRAKPSRARRSLRLRHPPDGERRRGRIVPWFNAPPGTEQRLGVFYLLSTGRAGGGHPRQTLRFTHGDRFPDLPGYRTFTSHWHMAISMAATCRESRRRGAYDARLREDVQGYGRGHRSPRRVPRRRPSRAIPGLSACPRCRRCSTSAGGSPTTGSCSCPGEEANAYLGAPERRQAPRPLALPLSPARSTGR